MGPLWGYRYSAATRPLRPRHGGGEHEGRHACGWGQPNPWRQRLRATPTGEMSSPGSRPTSQRDSTGRRSGASCTVGGGGAYSLRLCLGDLHVPRPKGLSVPLDASTVECRKGLQRS